MSPATCRRMEREYSEYLLQHGLRAMGVRASFDSVFVGHGVTAARGTLAPAVVVQIHLTRPIAAVGQRQSQRTQNPLSGSSNLPGGTKRKADRLVMFWLAKPRIPVRGSRFDSCAFRHLMVRFLHLCRRRRCWLTFAWLSPKSSRVRFPPPIPQIRVIPDAGLQARFSKRQAAGHCVKVSTKSLWRESGIG